MTAKLRLGAEAYLGCAREVMCVACCQSSSLAQAVPPSRAKVTKQSINQSINQSLDPRFELIASERGGGCETLASCGAQFANWSGIEHSSN